MLYMVMFVVNEGSPVDEEHRLVFLGDYDAPAIFEDRSAAVNEMNAMSAAHPDVTYFVQHVIPVPATPRPLL